MMDDSLFIGTHTELTDATRGMHDVALVILGKERVGKSCLQMRYAGNLFRYQYEPNAGATPPAPHLWRWSTRRSSSRRCLATRCGRLSFARWPCLRRTGAGYREKTTVLGMEHAVCYRLWDTAGLPRYQALAPMYYRAARAALVVYDVTDKASLSCPAPLASRPPACRRPLQAGRCKQAVWERRACRRHAVTAESACRR